MAELPPFKETHDFAKRQDVAAKILQRHPNRRPVIVERAPKVTRYFLFSK